MVAQGGPSLLLISANVWHLMLVDDSHSHLPTPAISLQLAEANGSPPYFPFLPIYGTSWKLTATTLLPQPLLSSPYFCHFLGAQGIPSCPFLISEISWHLITPNGSPCSLPISAISWQLAAANNSPYHLPISVVSWKFAA